jgi:hypothetical protein
MKKNAEKSAVTLGGESPDSIENSPKKGNLPPGGLAKPLRSAAGAKRFLSRLLVAFQHQQVTSDNVRASVYLVSEFLKSIETAEMESRIAALEKKVDSRRHPAKLKVVSGGH